MNRFCFSGKITSDYFHNIAIICQDYRFTGLSTNVGFNQTETVDQILELLDDHPCLSVIALCTLLKIDGHYPVSSDFEEQKRLIEGLTDQIVIDFEVAIEIEKQDSAETCAWADIDFEFVLDSSGFRINLITAMRTKSKFDENKVKILKKVQLVTPIGD